jgi:hypothetical protein
MSLFRCAGDVVFDNSEPLPGQICSVRLKQFSETSNFLQHLNPLCPHHPYFFAQIRALGTLESLILFLFCLFLFVSFFSSFFCVTARLYYNKHHYNGCFPILVHFCHGKIFFLSHNSFSS